jgi:thiamine-phosphate pyrophosphorylase
MEDRRSTLRIIDANLNRAAEALRVVEDVARFHWNLEGYAGELKHLRHALISAVCAEGRREDLFPYRDIDGDVGRETASPPVLAGDTWAMAFRNLERAKEAFRVLEEACRIEKPSAAARIEEGRYRLYAIEKGLGYLPPGGEARERLAAARVYLLLTRSLSPKPLEEITGEVIDGGVDMVQLREKALPDGELLGLARRLREKTLRRGALFIVNDRPDVALLSHADGVHLGQEDLPVAQARALVGEEMLIGVSTHSVDEARAAERQGADYIGVGPVFATTTKDAGPTLGLEGLRAVLQAVSLPAFPIGGIDLEKLAALLAAGAGRVACSSCILSAPDARAAAKALREKLK